jgi:hypothetical protein
MQTRRKVQKFTNGHERLRMSASSNWDTSSLTVDRSVKWSPVLTITRLVDLASTPPFTISGREPKRRSLRRMRRLEINCTTSADHQVSRA